MAEQVPGFGKCVLTLSLDCAKVLLGSEVVATHAAGRSILNQIGRWIGCLTLARNRPLLMRDCDLKQMLFDAYKETQLFSVVPFVTRILSSASKSSVFRPPNPWLMGVLSVLSGVAACPGLQGELRYEVELVMQQLGVSDTELTSRPNLQTMFPDHQGRAPDFVTAQDLGISPSSSPHSAASSIDVMDAVWLAKALSLLSDLHAWPCAVCGALGPTKPPATTTKNSKSLQKQIPQHKPNCTLNTLLTTIPASLSKLHDNRTGQSSTTPASLASLAPSTDKQTD